MKRTKEQAAETRQELLSAAEALFLDKGYENTTLDEIAATAGASRGAVHWHFTNKQGILRALSDQAQLPLSELAAAMTADGTADPLDRLIETIDSMFHRLHNDERQQGLIRVMMHLEISIANDEAHPPSRPAHEAMVRIFTEANKKKRLPAPWTPRTAASALSAAVIGVLEEWALERSDFPLIPYGRDLAQIIIDGFRPKGGD